MISIKEIAKIANVSIGTVDRAIHNRGRVKREKKELILDIIKKHNFKPNVNARNLKLAKTYKISILVPHSVNDCDYWAMVHKGIDQAFDDIKLQGITQEYFFYNKYKPDSLISVASEALACSPDGLIIAPDNSEETIKFINSIPVNTPYVYVDSFLHNTNPATIINQNAFKGGFTAGKLMELTLDSLNTTIAAIMIVSKKQHIQDRISGFQSYFKEKHNIDIKPFYINPNDLDIIEAISKVLDNDINNIGGIFVADSESFHVVEYISKKKMTRKIALVGYDLHKGNIPHLQNGMIDFIISQDPEMQGRLAINTLYKKLFLQEPVEPSIDIPINIITKENIDFHIQN